MLLAVSAALGGRPDRCCCIVGVTVLGGLLLAGTRRNVTLMPLVMALAGVTVVRGSLQRVWPRLPSR